MYASNWGTNYWTESKNSTGNWRLRHLQIVPPFYFSPWWIVSLSVSISPSGPALNVDRQIFCLETAVILLPITDKKSRSQTPPIVRESLLFLFRNSYSLLCPHLSSQLNPHRSIHPKKNESQRSHKREKNPSYV